MKGIKSNRGTSIIEVLVVMVVLLVGILTVVRLFPSGFKSVRHAESMTFAGRLAQYEIERWKNNAANLPDGTLPIGLQGGALVVLNDQFPGPPIRDKNDPDTGEVIDNNATTFRRIVGETTRIPFGGWSTGPTSGSLYVLSFSPIDTSAGGLVVRGGDLSRRIFDSDDTDGPQPWDRLRAFQYGIDYGEAIQPPKICFRITSQPRDYYISCSWWEQGADGKPVLRTATNLKVTVTGGTAGWVNIPIPSSPATFIGIDPYSDTVSRGFMDRTGLGWTSDPYEYQLIEPVFGIIAFNPLGYAQREFGRPLEARIDYDILDPEIIREDKRVPQNAPYRISLTLNRIKETGRTQTLDGTMYSGMRPPLIPDDVLAIDLETARRIQVQHDWINYKDGIIELPETVILQGNAGESGFEISPAGRNIRFFYKAEGDWSLQFHKAYTQYERNWGRSALDYRSYSIEGDQPQRLWFAACNGNNTISVDYEYIDDDGQPRKVVGECHKASDALIANNNQKCTYIDLAHLPTRIYSVNGVSARARVIWREGERWRHVDLDTILVRRPTD